MSDVRAAPVAALSLVVAASACAAPAYSVTDLGVQTEAVAINESGAVLGTWIAQQGVWTAGTWNALQSPPRFDPVAVAIDDDGEVAGYTFENRIGDDRERAFAWKPGGEGHVLKTGLGGQSYATGVSNDGTMVGGFRPKGVYHAYTWKQGALVDIGLPPQAIASVATAIARDGSWIAGICGFADNSRQGFVFQDGIFTLIGDVTGASAGVTGVNAHGEVVGAAYRSDGRHPRAFVYRHGKMQFIGTLGGFESLASAINGPGAIVGYSRDAQGHLRAFLYENGQMQALDDLVDHLGGLRLQRAEAINNAGQIVGTALDKDGATHGFRLDPLP